MASETAQPANLTDKMPIAINEEKESSKPWALPEETLKKRYPAKDHAKKVLGYLRVNNKSNRVRGTDIDQSIFYIEGGKQQLHADSDQSIKFRQSRFFYYLTGCDLPNCVYVYDVRTEKATLFIPPIDDDRVMWDGLPMQWEEALRLYDVDSVRTTDKLESFLASSDCGKKVAFVLDEANVSDKTVFQPFEKAPEIGPLKTAIAECRVTKDAYEIALIKKANLISAMAHQAVMKNVKHAGNERELEAIFVAACLSSGSHTQSYDPIVASGHNAAILHWIQNNKPITQATQNILLDAGGEFSCYASDITRTFPVSGAFSPESESIYKLVLQMQKESMALLHEGAMWVDLHAKAHRMLIQGFLELGIFKGDAEEIFRDRTSVAFFPHGLGHYLGLDTHDTGGHANFEDPDEMFKFLRIRGKLPAGSVVTVEPGIYFCKHIITPYLKDERHSQYIDESVLEKYWDVGGVRIEDNVLVKKDGFENLTTVPKEIEEMKKVMGA